MIRADQIVKRYGAVTAVDRLSFQVEEGETFALIGPNGAGKTTTLKILLGLTRPDRGSVVLGRRAYRRTTRGRDTISATCRSGSSSLPAAR